MDRILFICKNRELPAGEDESYTYSSGGKSSGLYNSVKFMIDMLSANNIECKLVDVVDNNSIDREVSLYKPTHVIIEALWVVPEKFTILSKLHPTVKWFVRLHSEIPFLSNEGIAFEWIPKYIEQENVFVASNSKRVVDDLNEIYTKKTFYLPNYYPVKEFAEELESNILPVWFGALKDSVKKAVKPKHEDIVNIGCFGAIRPLKNQFIQAIAAVRFADKHKLALVFHINGNRVEGKGEPILRNIRSLFANHKVHKLVEHSWMPHDEFVTILGGMDVTMQVSFTETYNIVAADSILAGVPLVVSKEITFVHNEFQVDPTNVLDIVAGLEKAIDQGKFGVRKNRDGLYRDAQHAQHQWLNTFSK